MVDTSALIDLYSDYPLDVFENLWHVFEQLIKNKTVCSPKRVKNELENKNSDFYDSWFKKEKERQKLFLSVEAKVYLTVIDITKKYKNSKWININSKHTNADPFVIGLAHHLKCKIITSENNFGHSEKNPKIPVVAKQDYDIDCLKLIDFFRDAGFKFKKD